MGSVKWDDYLAYTLLFGLIVFLGVESGKKVYRRLQFQKETNQILEQAVDRFMIDPRVMEHLVEKVKSRLKAGELIYDFNNYADQKTWENRVCKLLFDELPNETKQQVHEHPYSKYILTALEDKIRAWENLHLVRGLEHDYLTIGYMDPNTLKITYNLSEEAKQDFQNFESLVDLTNRHLEYSLGKKRVPPKRLYGAIRDFIGMQGLTFLRISDEKHREIRQGTVMDAIYFRLRDEFETKEGVEANKSESRLALPKHKVRRYAKWCAPYQKSPVSLGILAKPKMTPYIMRHNGSISTLDESIAPIDFRGKVIISNTKRNINIITSFFIIF